MHVRRRRPIPPGRPRARAGRGRDRLRTAPARNPEGDRRGGGDQRDPEDDAEAPVPEREVRAYVVERAGKRRKLVTEPREKTVQRPRHMALVVPRALEDRRRVGARVALRPGDRPAGERLQARAKIGPIACCERGAHVDGPSVDDAHRAQLLEGGRARLGLRGERANLCAGGGVCGERQREREERGRRQQPHPPSPPLGFQPGGGGQNGGLSPLSTGSTGAASAAGSGSTPILLASSWRSNASLRTRRSK
jgi:hypothetical protein